MSSPISVLDLTAGQIETIEQGIGVPVTRWGTDVPSMAGLYVKILSASTGEPEEKYRAMTLRELVAAVSLDGEADPNP